MVNGMTRCRERVPEMQGLIVEWPFFCLLSFTAWWVGEQGQVLLTKGTEGERKERKGSHDQRKKREIASEAPILSWDSNPSPH